MALYRNIAGFFDSPIVTTDPPDTTISPFGDPVEWQQQRDAAAAAYKADMNARYDWLLSHPYNEVVAAGFYVAPENGSIFKWTDEAHTTSVSHLSLDWIQAIENERGNAGTLLMHLQQPALAKDTAGFEGGSSGTFYEEAGQDPEVHQVVTPISEVQQLPPVASIDPGMEPSLPPSPPAQAPINTSALKANILPLVVLAGTVLIAVTGDSLIRRKGGMVFLGGVGTLFYLTVKKK